MPYVVSGIWSHGCVVRHLPRPKRTRTAGAAGEPCRSLARGAWSCVLQRGLGVALVGASCRGTKCSTAQHVSVARVAGRALPDDATKQPAAPRPVAHACR